MHFPVWTLKEERQLRINQPKIGGLSDIFQTVFGDLYLTCIRANTFC